MEDDIEGTPTMTKNASTPRNAQSKDGNVTNITHITEENCLNSNDGDELLFNFLGD